MFYEIRRYQSRPGRREEWNRYLEAVVIRSWVRVSAASVQP